MNFEIAGIRKFLPESLLIYAFIFLSHETLCWKTLLKSIKMLNFCRIYSHTLLLSDPYWPDSMYCFQLVFSPGVSWKVQILSRNEILFLWKNPVNHLEDILQESTYLGHFLIIVVSDCVLKFNHGLEPRVKYLFQLIRCWKY